ncbi:unnamed protein product, partial [Allacma fusca]
EIFKEAQLPRPGVFDNFDSHTKTKSSWGINEPHERVSLQVAHKSCVRSRTDPEDSRAVQSHGEYNRNKHPN